MQPPTIQEMGGKARAKSLSAERRSEIARKAAETFWNLPKATHEGAIPLINKSIPCAVLEDGRRLLTQHGFLRALGRSPRARGGEGTKIDILAPFLGANNLKPFISNELLRSTTPVRFRTLVSAGTPAWGYEAELLPQVCEVFLDARKKSALYKSQFHIAEMAELVVRGLARVGIVALIDEATGYQDVRDKLALAKILEKYLLTEGYRRWERFFQIDYYREIFRLNGWQFYPESTARPGVIGRYTNDIIYSRLHPGILKKLKVINPKNEKGNRKAKHHQFFTGDVGVPEVKEHLSNVVFLMKASDKWNDFIDKLDRARPKFGDTFRLPF